MFLEQHLVAPRIEERSIAVPTAVLLPLIVALSQFGVLRVLLAAPLIVVARDLYRYAYGRLSSPPAPAGVLAGERLAPIRSDWRRCGGVPDNLNGEQPSSPAPGGVVQPRQWRAPLAEAGSIFAGDDPPVVLLPTYAQRLRNDFLVAAGVALAIGLVGAFGLSAVVLLPVGIGVGLALLVLAVLRAFIVRVPEGTVALLNRGGKFAGELPPLGLAGSSPAAVQLGPMDDIARALVTRDIYQNTSQPQPQSHA